MVEKHFPVALDLKRPTVMQEFELVENDNGNFIDITLTDDGEAVDLTSCRVVVVFAKSNGTSSQDSGTEGGGITVDENTVSIDVFISSIAAGMVECELQVFSEETLVTTASFNFKCRKGIMCEETVQSSEEYPLLVGLIQQCEEIEASLEDIAINEVARQTAEASREIAESDRETAEAAREVAENEREAAESDRVSLYNSVYEDYSSGAFVGPQGEKGDKGDKGDAGSGTGDMLTTDWASGGAIKVDKGGTGNTTGNTDSLKTAFTAAENRTNIATGETHATLFGKIAKWLSDFGALAFKSNVGTTDITDNAVSNAKLSAAMGKTVKGNPNEYLSAIQDVSMLDVAEYALDAGTIATSIADTEYIPVSVSSTSTKKITWANIKAALLSFFSGIFAPALMADKTLYVATTGSDTTGDGSSGAPYATLQKAADVAVKNLNGYTLTINIAAGTYNAGATFKNIVNGTLQITGAGVASTFIVGSLRFENVKPAQIGSFKITASGANALISTKGASCLINGPMIFDGASKAYHGAQTSDGGSLSSIWDVSLVFNNCNIAMLSYQGFIFSAGAHTGTNNNTAVQASNGVAFVRSNNIAATTATSEVYGGKVFSTTA
ncbi:MAG TPA: BppU family phage baseplate upper protein [Clostridia bacterium]|nr:BppU family phage baseplate upper protein [Clostridia bacterium]